MGFDSIFDEVMKLADQAIDNSMASEFSLRLRDGSSLEINAIFDSKLMPQGSNKNQNTVIAEHGALTILHRRIDKQSVYAASVDTPLGTRYIADVLYPDEITTLLILSQKPNGKRVSPGDNFL